MTTNRRPDYRQALGNTQPCCSAHLAGGAIALVVGALQVNSRLRTRFLAIHRWLGRSYVLAIIGGGVAGLALALNSSGGPFARVGFGLLAVCWVGSTLNAWRHIRQRNLSAHRSWMVRSYALALAAVTLRVYLPLSQVAGIPIAVAPAGAPRRRGHPHGCPLVAASSA